MTEKNFSHYAIYLSNKENKSQVIQEITNGNLLRDIINLKNLKGEIYSSITLNTFLDEEYRHDHFELTGNFKQRLSSLSEGEQKKTLLSYLLSKKPEYLITDNIFDNLDAAAQQYILTALTELSNHISIIQIVNRKRDILPFIQHIYQIKNNNLVPIHPDKIKFFAQETFYDIPSAYDSLTPLKNPLVKMDHVSVSFEEKKVLHEISWEINSGEFWQLTGPNGSGKSTLLSMITGDSSKGYGQNLFLFGSKKGSGETVWEIKKNIGYFTSTMSYQFSRRDSIENMILSGFFDSVGLYVKPSNYHIQLTQKWLSLIGMYDIRNESFLNLSLGHQRLVLVVRAMVKHPPLLILDEPAAGLDDEDITLFTNLINKISLMKTSTILYVSHRNEPDLLPEFIFELIPSEKGSIGIQKK